MFIALGSIFVAMVLETLLILRAAGRAGAHLRAVEGAVREAGGDAGGEAPEGAGARAGAAMNVAMFVLVTLLGFALLAAALLGRGGG